MLLLYKTVVSDSTCVEPFENEFYIKIAPPEVNGSNTHGPRINPPNEEEGDDRIKESGLSIPRVVEVRKGEPNYVDDWHALSVKDYGEDGLTFFINMDNTYLLNEIKSDTRSDPRLLQARFRYGIVLIGISVLQYQQQRTDNEKSDTSVYNQIDVVTRSIAPVLLPMIDSLGNFTLD